MMFTVDEAIKLHEAGIIYRDEVRSFLGLPVLSELYEETEMIDEEFLDKMAAESKRAWQQAEDNQARLSEQWDWRQQNGGQAIG